MKTTILNLFAILVLLTGCQENWSDYYTQAEGDGGADASPTSSENLFEFLKSVPEYSEFVKLLEETEVSEELTREQVLTIWVPTNTNFPTTEIAAMNAEEKQTLCRNHINYVALYNTKLTNDKVVKTLAGKNLLIKELTTGVFSIDGKKVTKLNQKCSNGVIHEVETWLVQRKSIFEHLLTAGPDYSLIRDSILARSDTVFKPGLSFPLGVDELGNTIYDSVFIIENSLLTGKADVRSEDDDFTFFLPSNEVFKNMYKDMEDYFTSTGGKITKRDSSIFFGWILHAIIHEGKVKNYTGDLQPVYGERYEWRTDKQLVKPGYKVCSNGYLYDVEKIYVPKFLYLKSFKTYPHYILLLPEEEQSKYYSVRYGKPSIYKEESGNKEWTFYLGGPDNMCEFKTLTKDVDGNITELKIPSGSYKISASFRNWRCANINMYINNEFVTRFDASLAIYKYLPGKVIDEFEIKDIYGDNMLNIKLDAASNSIEPRMSPEYFLFEPTPNCY